MRKQKRWMVRVTYNSGYEAFLRHGGDIGQGAIVQFRDRKTADLNTEVIRPGLEGDVQSIDVVPYDATEE